MAFPLMVRAMRLSIEAVDPGLERAAATLGANRAWVYATVTLPLALPGVIAGALLCFAKALGEFGATITFVSNIPGVTQTLPTAIYTYTQMPGGDAPALRRTLVSIGISLAALVVFAVLSLRRGHPGARWIAGATGVFLLSVIFRTIDRDICASLSLGTHFLWHLLNGLMIGLLLQMLIRTGKFTADPA